MRSLLRRNKTEKQLKKQFVRQAQEEMKLWNELEFLSPYIVTLKNWLEGYSGDTSRLAWLTAEVLKYEKAHREELKGHVFFIMEKKNGELLVGLDEVSIREMESVLSGFFGKEEWQREWEEMQKLNDSPSFYRSVYEKLRGLPDEEFDKTEVAWKTRSLEPDMEYLRDMMLRMYGYIRKHEK